MVHIIITGGTFDKVYDAISGDLFFRQSHVADALELSRCNLPYTLETLMLMDSLSMGEEHRGEILRSVMGSSSPRILITHGTDAMAETARYLHDAFEAQSRLSYPNHSIVSTSEEGPRYSTENSFAAMSSFSMSNGGGIYGGGMSGGGMSGGCMGGGCMSIGGGHKHDRQADQAPQPKCVVMTGAMYPYHFSRSDALFNLGSALAFAQAKPPGVYIAMNGLCLGAYEVEKDRQRGIFTPISSPAHGPSGGHHPTPTAHLTAPASVNRDVGDVDDVAGAL